MATSSARRCLRCMSTLRTTAAAATAADTSRLSTSSTEALLAHRRRRSPRGIQPVLPLPKVKSAESPTNAFTSSQGDGGRAPPNLSDAFKSLSARGRSTSLKKPAPLLRVPTREADIRIEDLTRDTGVFQGHTKVLDAEMHHFTSPESQASIESDQVIYGSNSSSAYDSLLGFPDAPKSVYFRLNEMSDRIHFPFSSYPKSVPPGGDIFSCSISLSELNSVDYRMYYLSSTPSQFGPEFAVRVHSHVVFCREEHWPFADKYLHRLEKQDNRILRFSGNGDVYIPTKIRSSAITSNAPSSSSCRPHTVAIVVLGEMPLRVGHYSWREATRLKFIPPEKGEGLPLVECPIWSCKKPLSSITALKEHFRGLHSEFLLKCSTASCDFTTTSARNLRRHENTFHNGIFDFECRLPGCNYKTNSPALMEAHSRKHEGLRLECPKCDKTFSFPQSLSAHIKAIHDKTLRHCTWQGCTYATKYQPMMAEHVRVVHEDRALRCHECGKSFRYRSTLTRHRLSVHDQLQVPCALCSKVYRSRDALSKHMESIHSH